MTRNNRPPIPSELKRRVFLEAGHRCAIPTCKFPDVDVHHIVPWSKVKEHKFNNLIALCPNCHRRAHNGEIDRKSLLIYKSRLNALFGAEIFKQLAVSETKLRIKTNSENYYAELYSQNSVELNYYINIEYPKFANKEFSFINDVVERRIGEIIKWIIDLSKSPERFGQIQYYVEGSFHIGINTPMVVSLRSNLSSYNGWFHGFQWIEVFNYRTDQQTEIHIEDLFIVPRLGIKALSDYSIETIMKVQSYRDIESVKNGAGPESKNFQKFNITSEGLLVNFGEYQIGCYAEGSAEILVPFSVIRPYLSEFYEEVLDRYSESIDDNLHNKLFKRTR